LALSSEPPTLQRWRAKPQRRTNLTTGWCSISRFQFETSSGARGIVISGRRGKEVLALEFLVQTLLVEGVGLGEPSRAVAIALTTSAKVS
jgi:hypothetical protein